MIRDIFLKLALPNWMFALLVILLAGLAYLYYFRTLPPLSSGRRAFTILLRAAALVILLFLIMEPILRLLYQQRERPVLGVLVDNSASMKIEESYGERGDSLRTVLDYLRRLDSSDSLDIRTFQFDVALQQYHPDSLSFSVDGSNLTNALSGALDSLSGDNLQALVLASDGVYNQGANPFLSVQNSRVPVFTVLVGDSTPPKDVVVRRLQTNQITYVNKELPVEVIFTQNGFDGQKALLTIGDGRQQLAQQLVTFGKSGFEQKATLSVVAGQPGDVNYTARLQPVRGEVTDRNNQQTVRVQVLKNKLKVLVISGRPSFDRQSLSYIGGRLEDYDFTFLTEAGQGQYFEQPFREVRLDSQDLFIFQGFPSARSSSDHLTALFQQVKARKLPIFWLAARSANYQQLRDEADLLPFQAVSQLSPLENRFIRLTGGGRLHPVTKLDDNEAANDLLWRELPPIEVYPRLKMRQGAQVLLDLQATAPQTASAEQPPELAVCYAYRQNEIKQLVFNGANFSNWHFQLQQDPARDDFLIRFIERAVRWLVNRDDIQQIQIRPLQRIYNVGEPVVFSGQVYDEFYQAVPDARVVVTVEGDSLRYSDEMIAEGNGFYRQTFSGLPEGEFTYRVEARRNDQRIGVRSGNFTVKPFFLEFQQIPANATLMRQLAEQSNGVAYLPGEFIQRFPETTFENRVQYSFSEYFLWSYWHWLVAIVLLLGLEWFLRKRWGLL